MTERFPYNFITKKVFFHPDYGTLPVGTRLISTNDDLSSWEKGWAKLQVVELPEQVIGDDLIPLGTILIIELSKMEESFL